MINLKNFYGLLCIVGSIHLYSQLITFLKEESFTIDFMINQLFATRITSLFILDLFVTTTAYIVFTIHK